MTDDIDRQLAEFMGYEEHTVTPNPKSTTQFTPFRCWRTPDDVYLQKNDWSPTTNVAQALECVEMWCAENPSRKVFIDLRKGMWRCNLADESGRQVAMKFNVYPALAICLALVGNGSSVTTRTFTKL